jgi:hypothetical protein
MTVTRTAILNDVQWHKLRAPNVGASEVGALLGIHDYLTALELWGRKTGRLTHVSAESAAMERGRRLESVAVEMIAEDFPQWTVERPKAYFSDDGLRLGATPDLFVTDATHGLGIVQIKCVEPGVFRRGWMVDGELRPPLWIAVQAITEAHLTGATWASVAALVVSYGIDLHMVDVPIIPGVVQRIRDETAKFWHLVDSGRAPDPDFGRDIMVLRQLYGIDDGSEIDLTGDNEMPVLAAERAAINEEIKMAQARLDTINAHLLAKMGPAQIARFAGGYVTAKTTTRKAYTVAASTYRPLRIKLKDQAA